MSTIQTPKVAPAKATSRGSMKPIMLAASPPEIARKKADRLQAKILIGVVRSPIASALS